MKIFTKHEILKEDDMAVSTVDNQAISYASYISYGCRYIGNIEGESNVKIDGELVGDITLNGNLKVGDKGKIVGKIAITSGEVFGKIEGDIKCSETLVLRKGSGIKGNVTSGNLLVENGAALEGLVKVTIV